MAPRRLMELIILSSLEHLGPTRASVSYTFLMKYDQRFFTAVETSGGGDLRDFGRLGSLRLGRLTRLAFTNQYNQSCKTDDY